MADIGLDSDSREFGEGPVSRVFDTGTDTVVELFSARSPTNRLAICFGAFNALDQRMEMMSQGALIAAGFDVLAVRPKTNDFYQDLPESLLAEIVASMPAYLTRVLIGADMGGYAALYYARATGATAVLAFSPVWSPDRAVTPWEDRWPMLDRDQVAHRPLDQALAAFDGSVTILYDGASNDRRHVDMIHAVVPNASVRPFYHIGSPASVALEDVGVLDDVVLAASEERPGPGFRTLHDARRRSAIYYRTLAHAAERHNHRDAAESILKKGLDLRRSIDLLLAYGRFLAEDRRPAAALPYIDEAVRNMPPHAHWMAYRAHLEDLVGNLPAAADSYAMAAQYDPSVPEFRANELRVLRSIISLNAGAGGSGDTTDDRAALADLDRLKKSSKDEFRFRTGLAGIGISIVIVLVIWIVSGIFEWR